MVKERKRGEGEKLRSREIRRDSRNSEEKRKCGVAPK
jgi:hypothetical protein